MNDYLKKLNFEKIKLLVIAAVCFAAVFIAGFGAGKLHGGTGGATPTKRTLSNYTTKSSGAENKAAPVSNTNTTNKPAVNTAASGECYIKGSKSKIYHMPDGSFYDRTNAAQCFATETEAQAAGYTKSSR